MLNSDSQQNLGGDVSRVAEDPLQQLFNERGSKWRRTVWSLRGP